MDFLLKILSFKGFAPLVSRLAESLGERVVGSIGSTIQGTVVGGVVFASLETMGCDLSLGYAGLISLFAAAPSLLGTDPNKVVPTMAEVFKGKVQEVKEERKAS